MMTRRIKPRPRAAHVDREAFYLERRIACLSQQEVAQYLGVALRTVRNWERGTYSIPYPAFKLLRMRAGGIVHAEGWEDWRFDRQGALWSPDGRSFKSWELYHLKHVFSMARHFQTLMQSKADEQGRAKPAPRLLRLRLVGVQP
jgi:DNA-binding XRE family transcriptional regulator